MKRFYTMVTISPDFSIALDGRPVKTPKCAALVLPTCALAEAIAAEWRAQREKILPATMPLTGLANAAIDVVTPNLASFLAALHPYAETDVLCYRAAEPAALVARQSAAWKPLLDWAQAQFDIRLLIATGISHIAQPPATIAQLQKMLSTYDAFALAGLAQLITIGGSLITALALISGEITADAAFDATHLDELWQAERWGEDALATTQRTARKMDFMAAAQFVALVSA